MVGDGPIRPRIHELVGYNETGYDTFLNMVDDAKMPDPEALAREDIDRQLALAGWIVQDRKEMNLYAGPGIAIREVSIPGAGEADYLLVAGQAGRRHHRGEGPWDSADRRRATNPQSMRKG